MKNDIPEMINDMENVKAFFEELSKSTRKEQPESSMRFFRASEAAEKVIGELKRRIPQKMEPEGGGTTWWMACPECHGAIDNRDSFCRHCGQAVEQ